MNIVVYHERDYLSVIENQQQVHHLIDDLLHIEQDLYKQLILLYVHVVLLLVIVHINDVELYKDFVLDLILKRKKQIEFLNIHACQSE